MSNKKGELKCLSRFCSCCWKEALCEVFIVVGVGIDRSSSGCGLFGDDYQHRD